MATLLATPALPQGTPPIKTGMAPKPVRKSKSPASQPAASTEEAERAARLAEARRKFFANDPAPAKPDRVPEFGGYDATTMGDGSLRPGVGFKF